MAIIARYAVMENLYNQSSSLSLKPEYQSSLLTLCLTILRFFHASFSLAREIVKLNEEIDPNIPALEASPTTIQSRMSSTSTIAEDHFKHCEDIIKDIKAIDQSCQKFRVLVETKEESEDESESSDEGLGTITRDLVDELDVGSSAGGNAE